MIKYFDFVTTSNLTQDISSYFKKFNSLDTYLHTLDVIEELKNIEDLCGSIETGSHTACLCHDLGRVVKQEDVLEFCVKNNIKFSEKESMVPSVLHSKISCVIAKKVFDINDEKILNAIKFHSTSRKNPSMTEIEVILSDKMSWKEESDIELVSGIKKCLSISKQHALFYFLKELYNNRKNIEVYHTDAREAYEYFKDIIKDSVEYM